MQHLLNPAHRFMTFSNMNTRVLWRDMKLLMAATGAMRWSPMGALSPMALDG